MKQDDNPILVTAQDFIFLADSILQLVWITLADGDHIYYNSRWYNYTGLNSEESKDVGWSYVVHPDDYKRTLQIWHHCLNTGESYEIEYRLRNKQGDYRWFLARATAMHNEAGELVKWFGTCTDIHEQKTANERLRSILDTMPQITWTALSNGDLDYYNQRWHTYTGMSFEQTKGWGWEPVLHPNDVQKCKDTWTHSVHSGQSYHIEYRFRRAIDGQYRWHLGKAEPVRDEQGKIILWIGTSTDIHEQKHTQQHLQSLNEQLAATTEELTAANEEIRASNEELRQNLEHTVKLNEKLSEQQLFLSSIIDQSPFATWIADQQGTAIRVNEACRQLFGIDDLTQVIGKYNIFKDNTLQNQPFFKDIKTVFGEGKVSRFVLDYDVRKVSIVNVPSGKAITIILTLFPIRDTNGNIPNVVVQAEDITEKKQMETALSYQHLLTKTITDNATSSLFMMDKKGYCTFMNPAAEKMFGYSFTEITQMPLHYMIHHHRTDGSIYPIEECPIDRSLPEHFDIRAHEDVFFRKDGTYLPVSCAASPIFEDGVPVATVIEVRDISREQQDQQQLLQLNASLQEKNLELRQTNIDLDNFVYTASHDLKSPIANLEGLQHLLMKRLEDKLSEQEMQMLQLMHQSTRKLNQTIKDLTQISRTQKEKGEIVLVYFDELLTDVSEDLSPLIQESAAQIKIELGIKNIAYPKKHLRSILYNLLSNAIKYRSPERLPEILVRTEQIQDEVILTVSDNGMGIAEHQQHKLFQMFKRLHTHVEGSGIGLYMIKRMVDNNGGHLSVESKQGLGTVFRVYFKI